MIRHIHGIVFFLVFFVEFEWSFSQDLSAILVKQEEPDVVQRLDPPPLEGPPLTLSPAPPHRGSAWKHTVGIHPTTMTCCYMSLICRWSVQERCLSSSLFLCVFVVCPQEHSQDDVKTVAIKDEPREIGQCLSLRSGTCSTDTCTNYILQTYQISSLLSCVYILSFFSRTYTATEKLISHVQNIVSVTGDVQRTSSV